MENSVIERVKECIEIKGMSAREFAKSIGFNCSTLNNYITGRRVTVGVDLIQKIVQTFKEINSEWLLTGNGNMIKASNKIQQVQSETKYPFKPFIDTSHISSSVDDGFDVLINECECEYLSLPISVTYDFSICARGDSMINPTRPDKSIKSGDIVACRIWKSKKHIRWGEVYVLATDDGIIFKQVLKSDDENTIMCVSYNTEENYLPYKLPLSEVHDLALVVGVVKAKF